MIEANFDINEGTINFWIDEKQVDYSQKNIVPLMQQFDNEGNNILILRDGDGLLKMIYSKIGLASIKAEHDISYLKSNSKHMFTFTWSLRDKILKIYIDGKEVKKESIPF